MSSLQYDVFGNGYPVFRKDAAPIEPMGVAAGHHDSDSTCIANVDAKPLSDQASTISSERSKADLRSTDGILWGKMCFGHRMQPFCGYAHCVDHIFLLDCFLQLTQLTDVMGDSVKLLLRAIRLLHLCDYSVEDIASILAHASAYFLDAYAVCGRHMDASEVGNVLTLLMFIAHCYIQDETCPLHVWHRHLFRKYCPLKTLNAAVIRLLEIRHYTLGLDPQESSNRYTLLMRAVRKQPEIAVSSYRDD